MDPPLSEEAPIPSDIYLNVFPLFVKPCYNQDAEFSDYLNIYLKYLSSDFVKELPGVDPRYLSSLASLNVACDLEAIKPRSSSDIGNKLRAAFDQLETSKGNFIVLHFPWHSCDIVVFPDEDSENYLLFVPMELRRTTFSLGYHTTELGNNRSCHIALPRTVLKVEKTCITDTWISYAVDMQLNKFPGAYPMGTGRAQNLPDDRKSPTPTYILELLLPMLRATSLPVSDAMASTKSFTSSKSFVGQGTPWRRSVHWISIRFAAALAQRWYQFPLEQYKIVQLGFKTWLALQYHRCHGVDDKDLISTRVEVVQKVAFTAQKLLAYDNELGAVVSFVASHCDEIQRAVDAFAVMQLRKNECAYVLPEQIDLPNVSGTFALPAAAMQVLQGGPNTDMSCLREDISSLVSPIEFIAQLNTDPLLVIKATVSELAETQRLIGKQKPDLKSWTTHSMLHGTEALIFHCLDSMCNQTLRIDGDLCQWALELENLSKNYDALVRSLNSASPERKSREALASWCLVGLIDCIARRRWPDLFPKVGMKLPEELLQGLTLRHRHLMETAVNLITYKHSLGNTHGLFDADYSAATREFAVKFFNSKEGAEMASHLVWERQQEEVRKKTRVAELEAAQREYLALSHRCYTYYCRTCSRMNTLLRTNTRVIHPLPVSDTIAQEVIFFAALPAILASYGCIINRAYTLHQTRPGNARLLDCCSWSKTYGLTLSATLEQWRPDVSLGSVRKPLAENSHFSHNSHFSVDVVYPDFDPAITLDGVPLTPFLPDVAPYQYQLTEDLVHLPWMADARHPENGVLAAQHRMPKSMMKKEFTTFGRVRAAPNLQVRELIMAIESLSDIQLKSKDFLTLVQRVLYEMGPLTDTPKCQWSWKWDLIDDKWKNDLHQCLTDELSKIRQNWQSHEIMRLIIDIAMFAAQFDDGKSSDRIDGLLKDIRKTILTWIDEVQELLEEVVDKPDLVLTLRLRLLQLYSYLLLGSTEVTQRELQYRSELSVLKNVCLENVGSNIADLLYLVDAHCFDNVTRIHGLIAQDPYVLDQLLTKLNIHVPEQPWTRMAVTDKTTQWYNKDVYSINPISGLVLCDGLTVSELPSVIAKCSIYQEVMKNANFVVQRIGNEYVTRSNGAREFKFGLCQHNGQYPFIQEHRDGKRFALLPRGFLINAGLPAPLINDMAHWIDFDNRVIEFRPIDFRRTECQYSLHFNESFDVGTCNQNESREVQVLNVHDDHLSSLIRVLTKIDSEDNIICTKSTPNEYKIEYMKYNLSFTMHENGDLISDNYPCYKLAAVQSIATFPLYVNYLYIVPTSPFSTKLPLVLIPDNNQVYPYEFDSVQQRLIPATTLARLILARIYAQNSCATDPLTKITGLQSAFELIQQCWQNHPYTAQEFNVIASLMDLKEDNPIVYSIKLLLYHSVQVSHKLSFLHGSTSTVPAVWTENLLLWRKKYSKTKHLLPCGCTLDKDVEDMLYGTSSNAQTSLTEFHGNYFERVPQIFFSKETLPSTFKIKSYFSNETKVARLIGSLPSNWLSLSATTTIAEFFFSFLSKISSGTKEDLLDRLSFMAHNTLLKNAPGLELLQCLYCTIKGDMPLPDQTLLRRDFIYTCQDVTRNEVTDKIPSDADSHYKDRAWQIYSDNYLDPQSRPLSLFHPNYFRALHTTDWKYDFLKKLERLNDQRYVGKLFNDYADELKKSKIINSSTIKLTWSTLFEPHRVLAYAWPVGQLARIETALDPLNKNNNGMESFDALLDKCCPTGASASVDLNALMKKEKDIRSALALASDDGDFDALCEELRQIRSIIKDNRVELPPADFPLKNRVVEGGQELRSIILNDLKDSYQKYLHSQQLTPSIETDKQVYVDFKAEIDGKRDQMWNDISRILNNCDNVHLLKLWKMTHVLRQPHPRIIPALLKGDQHQLSAINPCVQDHNQLFELALRYAILQVHSIKLARVIELLEDLHNGPESDHDGFKSQLYTELSDRREWNAREWPQWLIFEMERRLCIRAIQFEIAEKMLTEKNIVLQLNMGEGKSKVIVPILCSVLANGENLVRINVLSAQHHGVHNYLKLALGNMLGKRIYLFPFRRNVPLNPHNMTLLRDSFEECKRTGGIILSTPEHRLSLYLKYREVLWQHSHDPNKAYLMPDDFQGVIDVPILELLDESDEILRYKYQLIYTLGAQQSIEGGDTRWAVHLALLRTIFMAHLYHENSAAVPKAYLDALPDGPARLQKLYNTLTTASADCLFQVSPNESHVLPVVRLLSEDMFDKLKGDLFEVLQLDPVWRKIEKGKSVEEIALLKDFVLSYYPDTPDGDKSCDSINNKLKHEEALKDLAILLTVLAHSTGIDLDAVKKCFELLKTKAIDEQRKTYKMWYEISKPIMEGKHAAQIQTIEAVNVENANLMQRLADYYGRNYEVVAYYLNHFVLPQGTRTFPEKIIANAWDLASSTHKVVGFSGTDDTKHTLPLHVTQTALASVESTNGKMVHVLTDEKFHNREYNSLPKELESEKILKEMCARDNWNVLIDSGALIEGMSNREVVAKVLEFSPRFSAGIFFGESSQLMLTDRRGNCTPLNSSRPLDLTCFTYLDDIHTRGTDLPFPNSSHAFVTVATGIMKDKLMQACMRMRNLVHGLHTVAFWGTSEVTSKIMQLGHNCGLNGSDITSTHIIEWVVENTIRSQEEAIMTYASQGFHHYATTMALSLFRENGTVTPAEIIKAVATKELLTTEELYGIPIKSINIKDHIVKHGTTTKDTLLGRLIDRKYNLTERADEQFKCLINRCNALAPTGKILKICGGVNEEYERELQQEVEEERQRELPAAAQPAPETKWTFAQINAPQFLQSSLAADRAQTRPKIVPLKDLFLNTSLSTDWRTNRAFSREDVINNIYLTENFITTVKVQSNDLSDYIRPLDVVIRFNSTPPCYLLVSLMEANELVRCINNTAVEFLHLADMRGTTKEEHRCIALLKLLNGSLTYTDQEKTALLMLLSVAPAQMDFIDQSLLGIAVSPALWSETWNIMARDHVLDKHNGFVRPRDDIGSLQGAHNESLVKLINKLNAERLFESNPMQLVRLLLTLRDTIRDYNCSDLQSLMQ